MRGAAPEDDELVPALSTQRKNVLAPFTGARMGARQASRKSKVLCVPVWLGGGQDLRRWRDTSWTG